MHSLSVKEICEKIWSLENQFDLINLDIKGVKPWQMSRLAIYYQIAKRTGTFSEPHPKNNKGVKAIKPFMLNIFNATFKNPFFKLGQVDHIIIEHPRSGMIDGKYVDIYSYDYLRSIKSRSESYLLIDRPDLNNLEPKSFDPQRVCYDFFYLCNIFNSLIKLFIPRNEEQILKKIDDAFTQEFGVNFRLSSMLISNVCKFKIQYKLYKLLFKLKKPKQLTVIVSYSHCEAIQAAKDCGIKTLEIQHGTFSRYHLGYSFPHLIQPLSYFPDQISIWGDFWKDMKILPVSDPKILPYYFSYFHLLKAKYANIKKIENRIVILSQGALSEKICVMLNGFKHLLTNFEIYFKLHPSEFTSYKQNFALMNLQKELNLKIVSKHDLYELLASSNYQIGVFSTAIYEGIGFGCKTILLDLPGIEYMEDLVELNLVKLVRDSNDFSNAISAENHWNVAQLNEKYLFGNPDTIIQN